MDFYRATVSVTVSLGTLFVFAGSSLWADERDANAPAAAHAQQADGSRVEVGVPATTTVDEDKSEAKSPKVMKAKSAGKAKREDAYVRISKKNNQPQALETAIVRFTAKPGSKHAGATVDLVGVIHIGELSYYKELNRRLGGYDVVLYELVAPDGTRIRPEDLEERRSILSSMQNGMTEMLDLEYQLAHIDYLAKNFRHADMSPEEFMEDMESRGDGLWKMFARMMGAGLASQAATGGDAGLLMALFSSDRPKKLRQVMAKQLTDVESVTAGMDDATGDNTLIKGRNRKAFEVMSEELNAGKKKIAVFYGAGHLSDMVERLKRDFEMTQGDTEWLPAWNL